jgi:hypothetical protein
VSFVIPHLADIIEEREGREEFLEPRIPSRSSRPSMMKVLKALGL